MIDIMRCTGRTVGFLCTIRPRRCRHDILDHNTNVHAVPHRLDEIPCLVRVAVIPSVLMYNIVFKNVIFDQPHDVDMCAQYSAAHDILLN
jgi:hypothetical protein